MRGREALIPAAVGAGMFAAAAVAGPLIAAGGVLAVALAAAIYILPVLGLGFMLLAGTALQSLGSEHITGLPLSLGRISAAATLAVWAVRSILLRIPLTWSPQLGAMAAFVVAVWLSGFAHPDPGEAQEGFVRVVQLVLLTVMIANIAGESELALDRSCILLTACGAASSLLGLAEFLLPSLALESDDPSLVQGNIGAIVDRDSLDGVEIKRVTGGIGDSNWFGYTLVAILPVNLYLFHRYGGTLARLIVLGAAGLQSMGVVLSFTRSAIIALAASVLWLVLRGRLPIKPLLVAGLVGAAGFAAWNPAGLERVYSLSYAREGGSTPIRTYLLRGAIALIEERPIQGYGYRQFGPHFHQWFARQPDIPEDLAVWEREFDRGVANGTDRYEWTNPHNTISELWVNFGLAGLLSYSALLLLMLHDTRLVRRLGAPRWGLLADCLAAAAIGHVVCWIFGALIYTKILWFLSGFAAALRRVAFAPAEGSRP
jgi:hypothetical protein